VRNRGETGTAKRGTLFLSVGLEKKCSWSLVGRRLFATMTRKRGKGGTPFAERRKDFRIVKSKGRGELLESREGQTYEERKSLRLLRCLPFGKVFGEGERPQPGRGHSIKNARIQNEVR